jgi:hypothetical protein
MTNMTTLRLSRLALTPFAVLLSSALVKPIQVIRVTNLNPAGAGSLREAIETPGPRLVVFEVGGVIDLGGESLAIREPELTIAGQTAPDPGITLVRGGVTVETHDVTIAHIAVRPGDRVKGAPDALGAHGRDAYNVVFDHCSATWAIDENLSVSGPADGEPSGTAHDVTLRSCLIAEGLSHATHPKGEHSKGTLIHDSVHGVTIIGCLYAHNRERNPRLKGGTRTVVAQNVMYDWGNACVGVGAKGNRKMLEPAEAVVVDNVAIPGLSTTSKFLVKSVDPGGRVFLRGNTTDVPLADDGVVRLSAPPSWAAVPPPAAGVLDRVLRTAGSRPAHRDPIDARIVRSVIDRTGRIIDSQEQVGGYPIRPMTRRKLVVPEDAAARAAWLRRLAEEVER